MFIKYLYFNESCYFLQQIFSVILDKNNITPQDINIHNT